MPEAPCGNGRLTVKGVTPTKDILNSYPIRNSLDIVIDFRTGKNKHEAYDEFIMYGGMPYLLCLERDEEKYAYLNDLFEYIWEKLDRQQRDTETGNHGFSAG